MKFLIRLFKRIVVITINVIIFWLIMTQIVDRLDQKLPFFFALLATYLISAYIILPQIIHLTLLVFRRGKIPRFTRARDGLYVDPVNIILIGSKDGLQNVFKKIGWSKANPITIKNSLKMIRTFIFNKSYPEAPFSSLFLFGRKQDIGFQEPIGNSPRERHHVRFWATNTDEIIDPLNIKYWTEKHRLNHSKVFSWIGSGSEDVGLGLAKFTHQISHRVNPNVDEERNYILAKLKKANCIGKINYYNPGKFTVGKYFRWTD
jgi:hypothetical protein